METRKESEKYSGDVNKQTKKKTDKGLLTNIVSDKNKFRKILSCLDVKDCIAGVTVSIFLKKKKKKNLF